MIEDEIKARRISCHPERWSEVTKTEFEGMVANKLGFAMDQDKLEKIIVTTLLTAKNLLLDRAEQGGHALFPGLFSAAIFVKDLAKDPPPRAEYLSV